MKKVWKFGCRWNEEGFPESITKAVFKNCGVVFAYTYQVFDMNEGDLVIVADGQTVIAIGQAITPPAILCKFDWTETQKKSGLNEYLNDSRIIGCKVKYHWLEEQEKFPYCKQGKFLHASKIEQEVNNLFATLAAKGRM